MSKCDTKVSVVADVRMEFEDFKANYDRVEICNMTPDALTESTKRCWEVNFFEGSWIRGSTAGGCRNYIGENSPSELQERPISPFTQ